MRQRLPLLRPAMQAEKGCPCPGIDHTTDLVQDAGAFGHGDDVAEEGGDGVMAVADGFVEG